MEQPEHAAGEENREELRTEFSKEVTRTFLEEAGFRTPIGTILEYLASSAFERGLGRDEAVRLIGAPAVFGKGGLIEQPLHECITGEIERVYKEKRGRRKFSREKAAVANAALKEFLAAMQHHDSVTRFFRDLVNGLTRAGRVVATDQPDASVAKGELLKWAMARPRIAAMRDRLASFVQPVVHEEYRKYITGKPEQYIANFLNDVFQLKTEGNPRKPNMTFNIANLEELFRDIYGAVSFEGFWRILDAHAQASLEDFRATSGLENNAADFFDMEIWRPSVLGIWKRVEKEERTRAYEGRTEPVTRKGDPVGTVSRYVSKKVTDALQVHFIILPPGNNAGSAHSPCKIAIDIQDASGAILTRAFVKAEAIGAPHNEIQSFVKNLLAGNRSRIARELRKAGVHISRTSPEVEALTHQLALFDVSAASRSNGHNGHGRNGSRKGRS